MREILPWENRPASKEETSKLKEEFQNDDKQLVSKKIEKNTIKILKQNKPIHNYGDEDQNEIMDAINEIRI